MFYNFFFFFFSSSFFPGWCEIKVPDQSNNIGKEDSILWSHQVYVDDLRKGPDLPVCQKRGHILFLYTVESFRVGQTLQAPKQVDGHKQKCRGEHQTVGQNPAKKKIALFSNLQIFFCFTLEDSLQALFQERAYPVQYKGSE